MKINANEVEALKRACVKKDLQEFDRVLRQQPALIDEIEFNEGGTILSLTCADGWAEGVKFLLDNYFDIININHKDLVGRTPLIQAACSGHRDCVTFLLSHPAIDVNIQDKDGFTALSGAVSGGKVDCVTILLSNLYIDINIKDKNGFTALSRAVTGGKVECVRLLLSHPNIDVNARTKNGYTALYQAVTAGKVDCVRLLLSHPNIDVNFEQGEWFDKTVLWYCKDRACYELLIPHFQTMSEHDKIMAWIWSLYYHEKGNVEEVKEVLQRFALSQLSQRVESLNSMVWIAANRGDAKMIEYLISSYGNIINANIQSKNGLSALSRAVSNDADIVRLLLSLQNIDINIQDKRGYTALYQAVSSGKLDCIRLLLSHPRINVNIQDKDGYTALYQAVTSGKADCLRLLLTHPSIDINVQDKSGETVLHQAMSWSRVECINILLNDPKIDVTVRSKTGKTAYEMKASGVIDSRTLIKSQPVALDRSKIMLVGQGRAGKTALANNLTGRWMRETTSTIGAEQMDMRLLKGGRLEESERPKHELQAFVPEISFNRVGTETNYAATEESNSLKLPMSAGKKTHVFLSHDWGNGGLHDLHVKKVNEALKSRGLITWIDDNYYDDIEEKIIDGIDHTECILVFLTENYVKKINGRNDKDNCWREFNYGFNSLGRERMIPVILDEAMRDRSKWGEYVSSALDPFRYSDLSSRFDQMEEKANRAIDDLYDMIRDNVSEVHKTDITTPAKSNEIFVYDVLLVSAFDNYNDNVNVERKYSLIDQINITLRKNGLVTFHHHDHREISRYIPFSKVIVVLALNKEIESVNEKFNFDFDLSSIRGKVVVVIFEDNKGLEIWAEKEFKTTNIYLWNSNHPFDHNHINLTKMIQIAVGEKSKVLIDREDKDFKEDKRGRTLFYSSLLLCTNTELFQIFRKVPITDIDSSNSIGYTPIQLYFFLFLNQFTFNCPSLEKITDEIEAKLFDPSNSSLCTKLSGSISKYKDTLALNGGDYGKVLLNNSLLNYFEAAIYRDGVPSNLGDQEAFKTLASGSLPTSKDFAPHKEILLSRMMTSSSDVLMEVKYFLVKIIFIILYQDLQHFYLAWEFLLHQLLSDALTVRTVLSSMTSFKKKDYRAQFFMIQTLTTKNIAKDFLSQRRPLRKVGEISNMLSRHLPKGSETLNEDAHSLMAKEINELYQKHDQRDLTYYLCGRIHRHRDNWIRNNLTQNPDLIEEEKRILTSSLNQSMKWIGYSLNSNALKDSPLLMSTFRTRKKELMNCWKNSIDQLILTLIESRLENWILPLLYLVVESIYSYQLLITHLLQLNLFQLPYNRFLLTVERKEFPSCLPSINLTESFQPPESNYDYHVELAELSWILLKDSRHVNFTSFNQGKAWLEYCHFPSDPSIKGESKNERSMDLKKIDAYFQTRETKSFENEAREIMINSETNDVWKRLWNIFGSELKLLAEPNIIEEVPDSKILHSVLSFNSLFNGEIQKFMKIFPNYFEEIHSILRKYVSTIFDYLFTLFMIVTNSFIRSPLIQGKPFEEFIKDCESDESLGRKYFPFLFKKLPLHYLNQFYAAREIMTQSDSVSFVEKPDIKTVVVSAIVKFLNSFGSTSDSDEEGKLYEFLNEIRSAPRVHITLSGDKRNIRNIAKKRVNSKESHEIRLKENLTKLSEETIKFEEPVQVESLPQITGSFVGHRMDRSVKVESLPHDEVFTSSLVMKFFTRIYPDSTSGRFILREMEQPWPGYTTFSRLQLIFDEAGETLDQCNVTFTNERLFIIRNLKGWALDRQFIHAIEDCPGGLFKASKRVLFKLKDPQARLQPSLFELRFPEEDVKQLFLNIQRMLDLRQACEEGRLEDFQKLLQVNPTLLVSLPIDTTKNTLLIMACARNKSAIAQYLLKIHGIDINKTTEVKVMKYGKETKEVYGALYYACINNMMDVVETLLSFKTIDVNILYTNEYSALQYAILKDMLVFKTNSKKSYARVISMLMQHPKTIWKIADNSDQYVIPTKWILEISTDAQKAILRLRDTPKNKFPVAFRDKLGALIQEKERKRESYNSLSGEIVRVDSSSTIATEDIESSSKICSMDSPYIINSKIFSSTVSGAVKNDPIADDIESSSKISRSQSSQSISSKLGDVDPFAEEVNQWKALLASLELPSNLKLSFVILNILKFEDDINIADSLKFYQTIALAAKQKKSWMLWKNQISAKSLPELLNGKDFESFKTLVLAEIEEKYAKGVADEETFKAVYQLKAQVKSLFLSSKEFVNEINQWKALLERLELSPLLQLSFVILNILILEDYISNFPETSDVLAKPRKLWMLWKDEIVTSIHKPLPEPLNGEDFKSIKTLMLAEIKEIRANYLDNTVDAKFFTDLDQLESLVERLALSSKKTETDCTNANSFVAEIVKNQTEDLVLSEQYKPSFEVTAGPASAPAIQNPFPLPPAKTSHVFISHAWAEDEEGRDNHHRVKYLNDILKKRGIVTWFDDDRIRQDKNVRTTLTNALYSTCCVLICITRKYEEKINKGDKRDHCLFEFNVATHDNELFNSIMTVVMEPSMLNVGTWKRGRLKAELGDVLYTDLSENLTDINFAENCEAIAENIITTLKLTQQIV